MVTVQLLDSCNVPAMRSSTYVGSILGQHRTDQYEFGKVMSETVLGRSCPLADQSLLVQEDQGLNPAIINFKEKIFSVKTVEKTKTI